jgi:predicted porin
LDAGDFVRTQVRMDEWRLRYIARVFEHETDNELRARFGLGATLAHRDLDFDAVEVSSARRQALHIKDDGVVYAAARAEVGYGALALRGDYGFSRNWTFGGDWHGDFHDLELTANYAFADQDVTVFAGYRRSELPARGQQSGQDFDADFVLDGFFVGARLGF